MDKFDLTFHGSMLLFFLFVIILGGLSYYSYRRTNPPVAKWLKTTLTTIRFLVLAIVLFIFFEPVLKLSWFHTEKPTVAVLLDNSASIVLCERLLEQFFHFQFAPG